MCICNRNWQANDCSERVCQFGLAHVDTPKGDLDASGVVSGPDHPVIENNFKYPYGTTEQFPATQDSDLNTLSDTAHYYMECSNKGICDRSTGLCTCYDGYDGVSCQRASCPGYPASCSGHGVCKTIKQLAAADNGNVYKLWDKDTTMGCECDNGYYGPDCSLKECKHGIDPLYMDDVATIKYSTFDLAVLSTSATASFSDGQNAAKQGYWAIRFFDAFGEDWLTDPIVAGASCAQVIAALEGLPNNVIPPSQTYCTLTSGASQQETAWGGIDAQHTGRDNYHISPANRVYHIAYNLSIFEVDTPSAFDEFHPFNALQQHYSSYDTTILPSVTGTKVSGCIYRLKFYGNPGALKEPQIEIYLDGKRPSLVATGVTPTGGATTAKVITKVWTDGQQGENIDYLADHCDGVTVTIGHRLPTPVGSKNFFLSGFTTAEKNLLKACLGDSDFDTSNNVDVYNWDYGSFYYPHLIKLVRTVTTYSDGGYYAVIWYDLNTQWDNLGAGGTFKLLNPFFPPDSFTTDNYEVYTTKGTLALTSNYSQSTFSFGSKSIFMTNVSYDEGLGGKNGTFDGDISCEVGINNAYKFKYIFHCLNKGDLFTLLNWEIPQANPPHINLYTAERLIHTDLKLTTNQRFPQSVKVNTGAQYMTHYITTDYSTNWGAAVGTKINRIAAPYVDVNLAAFRVYKFFPATTSSYEYVAECSNRGLCDRSNGVCTCFPGYTSDSCSTQSSLAL